MLSLDDRPGFTINANIQLHNRKQLIYDDSKNSTNEHTTNYHLKVSFNVMKTSHQSLSMSVIFFLYLFVYECAHNFCIEHDTIYIHQQFCLIKIPIIPQIQLLWRSFFFTASLNTFIAKMVFHFYLRAK